MQFSLKALMIVMSVVAVLCGILFSFPGWLASLLFFFVASMLPAALVTMIVYGDGQQRVFAIGAATTYVASALNLPPGSSWSRQFGRSVGDAVGFLLVLVMLAAAGWISVRLRSWLLRQSAGRRRPEPPPESTVRPTESGTSQPGSNDRR